MALEFIRHSVLLGLGATAFLDAANLVRAAFGAPYPDYGLVGRFLAHMAQGRFVHDSIRKAAAIPGETALGWTAHYLTGVCFAGIFLVLAGDAWLRQPRIFPGLVFGAATVVAPFLIMQPCMGLGIASSLAQDPWAARTKSIVTHLLFGLGLYVVAQAGHAISLSK